MSADRQTTFPPLPCYPCPYSASCCAYGVTVSAEEAAAIEAHHGLGLVYQTRWGEWRTRVRNKRCVLLRDGGCSIHDQPYYPSLCRGFPWVDAETGERYEYDVTICGAFEAQPELITIQRGISRDDRNRDGSRND
jgi:putative zinc- or iron-chelating protein